LEASQNPETEAALRMYGTVRPGPMLNSRPLMSVYAQ
jgi:hypothetical protein